MEHVFYAILFFIVAILLANPLDSVRLVVAINPHDSATNPQYNYPANPVSEKSNSKKTTSTNIFLLCTGLIRIAEACRKKGLGEIKIIQRRSLPDTV
jgi:hypothetical protein